jgi:hypothetical protein
MEWRNRSSLWSRAYMTISLSMGKNAVGQGAKEIYSQESQNCKTCQTFVTAKAEFFLFHLEH